MCDKSEINIGAKILILWGLCYKEGFLLEKAYDLKTHELKNVKCSFEIKEFISVGMFKKEKLIVKTIVEWIDVKYVSYL